MTHDLTRRDFIAAVTAPVAAAALGCAPRASTSNSPAAARVGGGIVVFQGDSITDAGRSRTEAAPNRALGSGYPLLIAAAVLRAQPAAGWQFYNRGISGHKVPQLDQRWDTDTIALKPDILSILIGVNDYWHKRNGTYAGTVADYEAQFAALLARTRTALPAVRVVVLEPFVTRVGAVDATWFPEFDERRAAAKRVAERAAATWVPLQSTLDELSARYGPAYWAADGVHPTPAGHELIAEKWRAAVGI